MLIKCPEVAKSIHRESGKIRLEVGFQKDGRGYGEKHIERPDRLKQLKNNGFASDRDFIEYIAKDYLKHKTPLWEKSTSAVVKRAGKGAVQSS